MRTQVSGWLDGSLLQQFGSQCPLLVETFPVASQQALLGTFSSAELLSVKFPRLVLAYLSLNEVLLKSIF